MLTIGVILSGCGVYDGSEIHEAVATLHALDQRGATARCLAPDASLDEIDHTTQKPTGQTRRVLLEAARIARGAITDLAEVKGSDFDAIVLPGGFGAAKNLCDFATKGADCTVHPEVARVLREARDAGKPLGFLCISPVVAARVFGANGSPELTIGNEQEVADAIGSMGATHTDADPTGIVVDEDARIVSTPCYMYDSSISQVFEGANALVDRVLEMCGSTQKTGQTSGQTV